MKNKKITLFLIFTMLLSPLYACGNQKEIPSESSTPISSETETEITEPLTTDTATSTTSKKKIETTITSKKSETKTTANTTATKSTTIATKKSDNSNKSEEIIESEPAVQEIIEDTPQIVSTEPTATEPPVEVTETIESITETLPQSDEISINLSDSGIETNNTESVSINGNIAEILVAGKYNIYGSISDGQIIVNAPKTDKVELYLNGVDISSSTSAPIYVLSADTCTVHICEGTDNYLSDTSSNSLSSCVFSKDDITFKGSGYLTVTANKKYGIKSSNDIKIKNGYITVSSPKSAVYGEDTVQISGGTLVITSCSDGIQTSNTTELEKGYVLISDGIVDVQNATGNGIEAITYVTISGGSVSVHSSKKSINCDVQNISEGCLTTY